MPFGWDLIPGINVGQGIEHLFGGGKNDSIPSANVRRLVNNPGYDPVLNAAGQSMVAKGQAAINARNAAQANASGIYQGGYASGGRAAPAAPAYNPADMAYLDDQQRRLQSQAGSADRALVSGVAQINDSYNQERDKANKNQSRALQDFALKREDTTRAKDSALSRVDTNARTLANSLRQKIGLAGGSGSSAYQITAPGAVAREASQERGGVQEDYGTNFRNLDIGENRVKGDFEDLLKDLWSQRSQRESELRSGILDRRNQIDNSLSEIARQRALLKGGGYNEVRSALAPYASAIDSRQSEIDSLFDKFRNPYSVRAIDTSTPELRNYTVDNAEIAQQAKTQDPYADALRKRQLEEDNPLF